MLVEDFGRSFFEDILFSSQSRSTDRKGAVEQEIVRALFRSRIKPFENKRRYNVAYKYCSKREQEEKKEVGLKFLIHDRSY